MVSAKMTLVMDSSRHGVFVACVAVPWSTKQNQSPPNLHCLRLVIYSYLMLFASQSPPVSCILESKNTLISSADLTSLHRM